MLFYSYNHVSRDSCILVSVFRESPVITVINALQIASDSRDKPAAVVIKNRICLKVTPILSDTNNIYIKDTGTVSLVRIRT